MCQKYFKMEEMVCFVANRKTGRIYLLLFLEQKRMRGKGLEGWKLGPRFKKPRFSVPTETCNCKLKPVIELHYSSDFIYINENANISSSHPTQYL